MADEVERRWRQDGYTVDAVEVTARAETRDGLLEALTHLPVIYRSAVLLHDAEGMTMAQVAAVQEVGLSAAKQRLRRGRMMLVSELARGHERRAAEGTPASAAPGQQRRQTGQRDDGERRWGCVLGEPNRRHGGSLAKYSAQSRL